MEITLTFNERLNESLQKGDTVWYLNTNQAGGYDTAKSAVAKNLGIVDKINYQHQNNQIVIKNNFSIEPPNLEDVFIMFSKDNRANTSSLIGYYAEVFLENNSTEKIELFAISSEIVQSSK